MVKTCENHQPGNLTHPILNMISCRQAPPPTGPKKPDIQPGPGRGQVGAFRNNGEVRSKNWDFKSSKTW